MREEIKPFYRFELFPNLKRLHLRTSDVLFPLGSFVVDGFAALKKLENLKICFRGQPIRTTNLFRGFLQLPLLNNFSLTISLLNNEEWELLKQFLRSQNNLESFSLEITDFCSTRSEHLKQSAHLENIIQSFNNKPSLKSLKLKSQYWCLETISKGLSQLKIKNQLQILDIQASDALVSSHQKPSQRIQGLCNFIKNQRESLKTFSLSLPLVIDDEIISQVGKALSELTQLKKLYVGIQSLHDGTTLQLFRYFEMLLTYDVPGNSTTVKVWNPKLGHFLQKIQSLESFNMRIKMVYMGENESNLWLLDVLKAFSSLPKLRTAKISLWSDKTWGILPKKMIAPVLELKNIREIDIDFWDTKDNDPHQSARTRLYRVIRELKDRQATRCDLMF